MYSKIAFVSALLALCGAEAPLPQHGHTVSSQSFIRHEQPQQHLATPIFHQAAHVAPLHPAPVYEHANTVVSHEAPAYHQAFFQPAAAYLKQAPVAHLTQVAHVAPVAHVAHVAPVAHVAHVAPVAKLAPVAVGHAAEEHAPAHYEFSYSVEDPHTGDSKSQHETRHGDQVNGEYTLLQPDGVVRRVQYTADDHSGFNAIVHNSAPGAHAAPSAHH